MLGVDFGAFRDALFPKLEVLRPQFDCGPQAEVSLGEGRQGRQLRDGVGGEVMQLQMEPVQESPEERTRWKSELALEVRDEHDAFSGCWHRFELVAGASTFDTFGDAPGSLQPLYFG